MEILFPHCAGLDLHKKTVVACRLVSAAEGPTRPEFRTFRTTTQGVLQLGEWLAAVGVTHVAMESTGVYWKPVYNLLEGRFVLLLVNAHKTLEGANIKVTSVASDLMGKSAREMLAGLVRGETDPAVLAQLAKGRMRGKIPALEQALEGSFREHQQFLLARQLAHVDELEALIAELDTEVARRLAPHADVQRRLQTIPGIARRGAEVLLAELGRDMSRFPSYKHLVSWAGMCPGQHESGGKRKKSKSQKGNRWLRQLLVEAAHAVKRQRDSYPGALFRRVASRRGAKRAAVAVGHHQLIAAYFIIRDGVEYEDLGGQYFDERDRRGVVRRSVKRLEDLGYDVEVRPKAAA